MDKYYNYKNVFYKYKYNHDNNDDDNFTSSHILSMQTCEYNIVDYDSIFDINENSKNNIIVLDNFYEDPYKVRNFILSQDINITSEFPVYRSKSFTCENIKSKLEDIIGEKILDFFIIDDNSTNYNRNFFFNTEKDNSRIHPDFQYDWVCIVYLIPDAPYDSGLKLYKQDCIHNLLTYNIIDEFGNVFNRLLIFESKQFHILNKYFEEDKYHARLRQTFFFNTNKKDRIFIINQNINQNIKLDIIIVNDFYKHPEKVREFAIQCNFETVGNFPGLRTKSFATSKIKEKFEKIIGKKIIDFPQGRIYDYNGCFQYTLSNNKSWIHVDNYNNWAGVLYLTPDAPLNSGTKFYEFNDKSITDLNEKNKYSQDFSKWTLVDRVGNVFNRLLLFNSKRFHISDEYFGNNIYNSRLFQVFFFTSE